MSSDAHCPSDPLTKKELAVLSLLADGYTYSQAATRLGVCFGSVKVSAQCLRAKFNAKTTIQVVAIAIRSGLIP